MSVLCTLSLYVRFCVQGFLDYTIVLMLECFRKENPAMDDATSKYSAGKENGRITYAGSPMKGNREQIATDVSYMAVLCNIIEMMNWHTYIISFTLKLG